MESMLARRPGERPSCKELLGNPLGPLESFLLARGLRTLDLSGCQKISEAGVESIAKGCTGLAYLNLSGCERVGRRFLMHLLSELRFSDPAHT